MLVSMGIYVGAAWFELYPLEVSAVLSVIIAFGQSRKQRQDLVAWALEKADRSNWKPKPLLYPCMIAAIIVMYIAAQEVDSMCQEIDYVTDGFVLLCLGFLWVTQPAHLRLRDRDSYVVIVLCVKMAYFLDRQKSMNFETEEQFNEYRMRVASEPILVQAIPLVLMIFLENKISRHYRLGPFHKLMTHGLTVMLMANYLIAYQRPKPPATVTKDYLEQQLEHA